MPFQTTKLLDNWAVEVDFDLSKLTDEYQPHLNQLLLNHELLLFRNQTLTDEQLYYITTSFGEPWHRARELNNRIGHTQATDGNHPYIELVSESGTAGTEAIPWHIDVIHTSSQEIPNRWLYCVELEGEIEHPGTDWMNTRLSYHRDVDFSYYRRKNASHQVTYGVPYMPTPITRPCINHHPRDRQETFLCDEQFTIHLEGMNKDDGLSYISNTIEQMTKSPGALYSHSWQVGDIILYDNLCTMHRRSSRVNGLRRLKRMTWDQNWLI